MPDPFRPRRLVILDLDGTLYHQGLLRRRMSRLLMVDALRRRDLTTLRVLRDFRKRRERMAEAELPGFEPRLFAETARATSVPEAEVRDLVAEWIDMRPLPHLPACAVAGAGGFIAGLRDAGVAVAVLSDYPAEAKLAAMGFSVDHTIAATDPEVGVLKPNPAGLAKLLDLSGCRTTEALMIGDRAERDGAAAARLGIDCLLRHDRRKGPRTFNDFTDSRLAALRDEA